MMGFGMMGGGIMWVLILIIGVAIYLIVNNQRNTSNNYSNYRGNNALDTLKEKYASGEITEEEYLRKKKILRD